MCYNYSDVEARVLIIDFTPLRWIQGMDDYLYDNVLRRCKY